jgi:hypothetical protein
VDQSCTGGEPSIHPAAQELCNDGVDQSCTGGDSDTGPDSVETGREVTRKAPQRAGLTLADMDFTVSTGYGRLVIPFADKNVSEISCHARGASPLFPSTHECRGYFCASP